MFSKKLCWGCNTEVVEFSDDPDIDLTGPNAGLESTEVVEPKRKMTRGERLHLVRWVGLWIMIPLAVITVGWLLSQFVNRSTDVLVFEPGETCEISDGEFVYTGAIASAGFLAAGVDEVLVEIDAVLGPKRQVFRLLVDRSEADDNGLVHVRFVETTDEVSLATCEARIARSEDLDSFVVFE